MKQFTVALTFGLVFTGMFAVAQDSTARKELIGKYKFPAGSVVEEVIVVQDNGMLMMNSSAGTSSLELIKGDSFNIVNFNGIAVFKRNEMKKITGVHIDASGYVLEGVKDSAASHINGLAVRKQTVLNEPLIEWDLTSISDELSTKSFYVRRYTDCLSE